MNSERTIPERATFERANEILLKARGAEKAGAELPQWFRSACGGLLEGLRLKAFSREGALLAAAVILECYEALPFELQDLIDDAEPRPEIVGGEVPGVLPADFE